MKSSNKFNIDILKKEFKPRFTKKFIDYDDYWDTPEEAIKKVGIDISLYLYNFKIKFVD